MENAKLQERYAIGRIRDIERKGNQYDAIIEVTDAAAREAIENHEIPFYVSPRIIHDPNQETNFTNWLGLHLAVVSKPAFGVDKATIKGACYGMADQCRVALKEASVKQECGFCVKTELLKLREASIFDDDTIAKEALRLLVTNHDDSSLSSLSQPSVDLLPSMSATVQAQTIDTSRFVSMEDYNALKTQVEVFKTAAEEAKSTYQKQIDALVQERTIEKISAAVRAKISDPKKAEETINKFVSQKASPELVKDAMALIPEPQKKDNTELFTGNVKDASANPKAGSYTKAQTYMNSIIKGASY